MVDRWLHVPNTSLHRHNENIRIVGSICYFFNEHLVSLVMPVISKEPGSMHVQTPRCFIPRYKDSQIRIFLSSVGPVKVPHQHIENTFWGERLVWSKRRWSKEAIFKGTHASVHGASIQHTADIPTVSPTSNHPFIFKIQHRLFPNTRPRANWTGFNGTVLLWLVIQCVGIETILSINVTKLSCWPRAIIQEIVVMEHFEHIVSTSLQKWGASTLD